ncbi:2`-O-ribosyl phosphate transferase RIT1 [Fusarium albosuccineum]|uniref:2`-O-ribosyl phosphate transferase RIT1 n=1 Tax=Fusarium albosuccineum TaxID=1237068 RepID=A0A8H4KNY2_9HYPO|nr:2`-O-ribosyl phosphate transferase RIT1 [Fusarium albosuccineum]
MPEPHFSDLIFPHQEQPSMSQLMASLKRTTLTIHNRLNSIRADAEFVKSVSLAYAPRPLVANERCGSWYIPPARKTASAYFKSTDGHERAWKFSTRRLNLHLVNLIEKNDGIIIVDSTRRGKRMPDALSSTIPIWCTVLNLTLLPSHPSSSNLYLPPHLPATTHAQISALIPEFVASLKALNLDLPTCLTKPLRPVWVTPDSSLPAEDDGPASIFDDFRPVICCTASRRVVGSEMDEGGYIQGAADDTEMWAHGLAAPLFWAYVDELVKASEADLPGLISHLVMEHDTGKKEEGPRIQLTPNISVCALPLAAASNPAECRIAITQDTTPKDSWIQSKSYMQVGLGKSKTASRNLRVALPEICTFASTFLSSLTEPGEGRIIIACKSGRDLSVGVALTISCYLFDDEGNFRTPAADVSFTKTLVKSRLGFIMTTYPEANPSRSTLQSVNSFLMDWRK